MVSDAQIKIEEETRERLFAMKEGSKDTYDEVIRRLMEQQSE